jgi:hypothetical protein
MDPTLAYMIQNGGALTKERWIDLNYPDGVRIDRLYAFDEEGTVLHQEILAGNEEVLAA